MKFKRLLRNWDIWGFLRWRNYICCWEKEFLKMTSNDKLEWVGTKSSILKPWRRRVLGTWREFDNRWGILDKKLVIILTVSVVWGQGTVWVRESQQKSGQEPETQPHPPSVADWSFQRPPVGRNCNSWLCGQKELEGESVLYRLRFHPCEKNTNRGSL